MKSELLPRVKVPEAAKVLGMNPNELRKLLRQGKVPFGRAVEVGRTKSGNPRYQYLLWKPKLLQETGLKEWPVK